MAFMQWSAMLEIDGGTVDGQHRQLIDALNAFHAAVGQGQEVAAVRQALDFLGDYGRRHFTDEEAMLAAQAYPRLEEHRRQHAQFLEQVRGFGSQLADGGVGLAHSMGQFLGNWLVNHILVADKAYAAFLRGSARLPVVSASKLAH